MENCQTVSMKKTLTDQYDEEYLQMKLVDLRQKLDSLARTNASVQPEIDEIRSNLENIRTEVVKRVRWNLYQISLRRYLRICPSEELLSAFLGISSRVYRLDVPNKQIWDQGRLKSIEQQIVDGPQDARLRLEIEALAKAIDECGFRFTRDNDLKSEVHRNSLYCTVAAFLVLLAVLFWVSIRQIDPESQWQELPILLFGVNGGLLSATLQQRRERMYRHTMSTVKAELLFRAVCGAIAAVIVTMLLELRIVDFPFLHSGNLSSFPVTVLYIVGFASGFTERLFIGAMEKVYPKRSGSEGKGQEKKQGQQAAQ
jgi:hypothetical protein